MKIFNTMTRKLEPFKPIKEGFVSLYTCGPTVYNYAHIGNFRTYIFEDLLRRFLIFKKYKVKQVMNLTDVDDKTIRDSQKENLKLNEFTQKYIEAFFEDCETLRIKKAEVNPRATEHIKEMVQLIQTLLDKGHAYLGEDDSIYYSIKTFEKYGELAHIKVDELKAGARVKQDEYEKDNVADFALWKAYDERDGDVFWEEKFIINNQEKNIKGRPGWHIECSAMSMKHLSNTFKEGYNPSKFETIDLHTGGVDNIFPHHQDEIAQSEGVTEKEFVKYWMHSEHLLVENKKMSKSLGNFYTLRDLLAKGYSGREIRYVLMATHYKMQLNFTFEGLNAARETIKKFDDFMLHLNNAKEGNDDIDELCNNLEKDFESALDEDLNISKALSHVFTFISNIYKLNIGAEQVIKIKKTLRKINEVLDVIDEIKYEISNEIKELVKLREEARKNKNWQKSDELRDKINNKGFHINDTKEGPILKKI